MTDYDDLRSSFADDDDNDAGRIAVNTDDFFSDEAPRIESGDQRFLGMSAGERALISVMIFFVVLILGIAVLVVTDRIVLPV
jgi:hypothetical protein